MCDAINARGQFDPELCPLLKDLSDDERRERMLTNPRISACIATLEGRAARPPAVCPHPELTSKPGAGSVREAVVADTSS